MVALAKLIAVVGFGLLFSACATNKTPRADAPRVAYDSASDIDTAAACLVQGLNVAQQLGHSIQTIAPRTIYEVAPQKEIMAGGEPYFVRVSQAGAGSRIELFAIWQMNRPELAGAVRACAV